jgi:type II secretory pathway component PulK
MAMSESSQRGAVLVIALLLLVILTLLAITGMRTAIAELWMAGNEQFHRKAVEVASAGIEVAIARLQASGAIANIGPVTAGESPSDSYTVTIRRTGREASLPGSSAEKLVGEHFEIESTGTASRGAREVQVQGVMVVSSPGGVQTFERTGGGLAAGSGP